MAAKDIKYGADGRERIKRGVDTIADAVKVTLGPRGRTVMLEWAIGYPHVTKDGVKVARYIDLVEEKYEQMGARMVYEVAKKTSKIAGDGTTTASVLVQGFFREGCKLLSTGINPKGLKHGMDKAVEAVVEELKRISKPVNDKADIANIATIAANNNLEVGDIIADAKEKVGKDGVVIVQEGKSIKTTVEVVEGMHYNRGYISPHFINDEKKMRVVLENPFVLIYHEKLTTLQDLITILRQIKRADGPLFIIADEVEGQALATLVANKKSGSLDVAATKPPGFGERRRLNLDDIAVMTGGKAISKEVGLDLKAITLSHLGRCKRVIVDKENTYIIGGAGRKETIDEHVRELRAQIRLSTWDYDREQTEKRLAKLIGGVAVIDVGGTTETEVKEKKERIDNALNATNAAIEEGIIPGGGTALVRCLSALDHLDVQGDEAFGVDIVKRTIEEPLRQIADNGGFDGAVVVEKVKELNDGFGFNAQTGEYGDLIAQGVVDPTKVTRLALQHAASLTGTLITTETVVTDRFKKATGVGTNPHGTIPGLGSHMAKRAAMGPDVMDEMIDEMEEEGI
jgi:chaperonin GroEL